MDFDKAPFVVIWETTQACDLACRHCRACAQPERDPRELTTAEAKAMISRVRDFGRCIFVFSGGDALGSFEHGLRILRQAQEIGLSTQVNTVIRKDNLADMDDMCALMEGLGVVFWEVFFLVPMGRATPDDVAGADEFEAVFDRLYELSKTAPFDIKATAAPHYARAVIAHKHAEAAGQPVVANAGPVQLDVMTNGLRHSESDGIGRARNVNDGDGFMFISHIGEIFPSGFLPIAAGTVRDNDLVEVYRTSELFTRLRDRSNLSGKCGVCNFRAMCGGSRARAYAVTGDPFEAEPFCAYTPPRWAAAIERDGLAVHPARREQEGRFERYPGSGRSLQVTAL